MALRYEQLELQKQFVTENEESAKEEQGVGESFPCGVKAGQNAQRIKLLDALKAAVEQDRFLHPEFEQQVTEALGPKVWKMLTEWTPLNNVSICVSRLNEVALERSKIFGFELPEAKASPEEEKKYVTSDGVKEQEMILKIINIYKDQLLGALRPAERGGAMLLDDGVSRLDLSIRYQTTARRDFYRSLREYREAKNPG